MLVEADGAGYQDVGLPLQVLCVNLPVTFHSSPILYAMQHSEPRKRRLQRFVVQIGF